MIALRGGLHAPALTSASELRQFSGMDDKRADYKSVWTSLSTTVESARFFVAGHSDVAKLYDAADDSLHILFETVGLKETDVVLEIGCGVGRVGAILSPYVKEWIGCDVSPNMLHHARTTLLGLENTRLQEISGYDLQPIPDASIDVVYTTVVFMHLEEWDRYAYVKEALRVLKPGGRFYCDNIDIASDAGWEVFQHGCNVPPKERSPYISKFSSVPEFQAFLDRAGYEDVHVATRPMWVYAWGKKPA